MEKRIFGLDLLRAFAISFYVLFHSLSFMRGHGSWQRASSSPPSGIRALFLFGWIGVDLFFVLSGYLIGSQVFQDDQDDRDNKDKTIRAFWIRRWTRTLPLYFFILALYFLAAPLFPASERLSFFDGKTYFFFIQNFSTKNLSFSQSWSLCVEEQFYIIFPILFFFTKKYHWAFWLSFLSFSLLMRMRFAPLDTALLHNTFFRLDGLAVGAALAGSQPVWRKWNAVVKSSCLLFGFCALIFFLGYAGPGISGRNQIPCFSVLALAFGSILVGSSDLRAPRWVKNPIRWFALLSYGVYLWNDIVSDFLSIRFVESSWILRLTLDFVLSLTLAGVTYWMIEKPGLALRKHLLHTQIE